VQHDAWLIRIEDMLVAAEMILEFTQGKNIEDLRASPMMMHAVLHDFAIIGEAASHVPEDVAARHPEIAWRQMRAFRNIIVHEYGSVRTAIVWETVENDLRPLIESLRVILSNES
jgi:uncharacterized protein with HEPN domain